MHVDPRAGQRRSVRERRGPDEVGEGRLVQGADDRRSAPSSNSSLVGQASPGSDSRAQTIVPSEASETALDRGDRALEGLDDLGHRDLDCRPREHVAAARAAPGDERPAFGAARRCSR